MKLNYIKYNLAAISLILALVTINCESGEDTTAGRNQQVEYSPDKDLSIQKYNISVEQDLSAVSSVCDTFALANYILDNYPPGSYLATFDKTLTFNIPRYAVHYLNRNYILALVATSRPGERLIEIKNIVGYDQSFINLDSTKLGTAFFYLTLFDCRDGMFDIIWETPVPNHGGFNNFSVERWVHKRIPYVRVNFHYGRGNGHINYNYFMINGWDFPPHLIMTYHGVNFKRTITNYNDDVYPDYYEYAFYDMRDRIAVVDSVPFIWNSTDSVYINTRNKRQTRLY
jgi:hypothetical protein